MLVKDLGGHSGCKILLYEENGKYYVRKISASLNYNQRLEEQCLKQQSFNGKSVKTPLVLSKGYDNGLFYFDMEYIKGITLAKYISTIDVSQIGDIADIIIRNVDFATSYADNDYVFKKKVLDLKKKTAKYKNRAIENAVAYLLNYSWASFSNSFCHGDLTLENIIVKNGEMYYIDFLDSFCDSWIMDIGKLLQDVECMWSYRDTDVLDSNTKIRLVILKELLIKKLNSLDKKYIKDSYAALLLNLIRIYPYIDDKRTYLFLNKQVGCVLEKLRSDFN